MEQTACTVGQQLYRSYYFRIAVRTCRPAVASAGRWFVFAPIFALTIRTAARPELPRLGTANLTRLHVTDGIHEWGAATLWSK